MSFKQASAALFDNVGNVSIYGGNYNQQNIQTIDISKKSSLDLLLQRTSLDAMHDASARDPPPRCSEGTRKKVLADIMTWIKIPQPRESVLWLNGPFGNGKSAIMQTIAETLRKDPQASELLAGSFFFGRGLPGRDKAEYLIPTIAYQVVDHIPGMRQSIEMALSKNPTIFSKSMDIQLRRLLTEPLQCLSTVSKSRSLITDSFKLPFLSFLRKPSPPFHTPTVIIDGLDECDGSDVQQLILDTISTAIFEDHIKLRFLIASRPEAHIKERFMTRSLNKHHYPITLDDDYKTRKELLEHLRTGFDDIFKRKSELFATGKPWPSEKELEELARRASGQFLYAHTVLKFVDSDDAHPRRQLDLILTRQPGSGSAFSRMDELYTLILEACPLQEHLPSFLCSLVLLREVMMKLRMERANLGVISGLEHEDLLVILRRLPAVIAAPDLLRRRKLPDGWTWEDVTYYLSPVVWVHHQSFIEYLTNKTRSGIFFTDTTTARQIVSSHLDTLIVECLSRGYRKTSPGFIHDSTWSLARNMLETDLEVHGIQPSLGWPGLQKVLDDFRKGWKPPLSKLPSGFFEAIAVVYQSLQGAYHKKPQEDVKECLDACRRILYSAYHKHLPLLPTSTVYKIAAVVSLPHFKSFHSDNSHYSSKLLLQVSEMVGISMQTTFQILKENPYFFQVIDEGDLEDLIVAIKPEIQEFLLAEAESGEFHFAYRRNVILELRSKLVDILEESSKRSHSPLDLLVGFSGAFRQFTRWRWDIRPTRDREEASLMRDVFELLHAILHAKSWTRGITPSHDGFYRGIWGFGWICRQLHIIEAIPEYENTAEKLRDIINLLKHNAMRFVFAKLCYEPLSSSEFHHELINLPPFGTLVRQGPGSPKMLLQRFSDVRLCYTEASFLWNHSVEASESAKFHRAIIEYHISVWLSFMAGRFPYELRKVGYEMFDEVDWESHFRQTPADTEICNHLLTIHFLLTKRNDLIQDASVSEVVERLPLPFLTASLTWYRTHYNANQSGKDRDEEDKSEDYRGEGFEAWCEQIIVSREQ